MLYILNLEKKNHQKWSKRGQYEFWPPCLLQEIGVKVLGELGERENLHTLAHAFVINFRGTLEGQCIL